MIPNMLPLLSDNFRYSELSKTKEAQNDSKLIDVLQSAQYLKPVPRESSRLSPLFRLDTRPAETSSGSPVSKRKLSLSMSASLGSPTKKARKKI